MSSNLKLIPRYEIEAGKTDKAPSTAPNRAAKLTLVPVRASRVSNPIDEEVSHLIQHTFLSANGITLRQVVLCGVDKENGSSSICASVGRALADNCSRPVCMVDANARTPILSWKFGITPKPLASPSAPMRDQCLKVATNLYLGYPKILTDNNKLLLPPIPLKGRLSELRDEFEYTLIDAPATSVCGIAQVLGSFADAAILVIDANRTRRLAARNAKESLENTGVHVVGAILCNRSFPTPEWLYTRL